MPSSQNFEQYNKPALFRSSVLNVRQTRTELMVSILATSEPLRVLVETTAS